MRSLPLLALVVLAVLLIGRARPVAGVAAAPASETVEPEGAGPAFELEARGAREFPRDPGYSLTARVEGVPGRLAEWSLEWIHEGGSDRFTVGERIDLPDARPGHRLVVRGGFAGERAVLPDWSERVLGELRELELVGEPVPLAGLRVVDAATGRDLPRVRVLPWTRPGGADFRPPVLHAADALPLDAPLALPANPRARPWWIGAEGHAWRRLEFGAGSRSPILALERGGDLRVRVELPADRSWSCMLLLHGPATGGGREPLLLEHELDGRDELLLEGLVQGEHRLELIGRRRGHARARFAQARATVRAGELAEVSLAAPPGTAAQHTASLELELLLEDERDRALLEVVLECRDRPAERAPLEGTRVPARWRSGPLPAGPLRVRIEPAGPELDLLLVPGEVTHAFLQVPALPRLRLWVVDGARGELLDVDEVLWRPAGATTWKQVRPQVEEGGQVLPIAPGPVEVAVMHPGHASARRELVVGGPWTEETLELAPLGAARLRVHLRAGAATVPAPPETWNRVRVRDPLRDESVLVTVQPGGGPGHPADGSSAILVLSRPGRHELLLPEIPGFVVPGPLRVEVDDGPLELEIELTLAVG